MWRLLLGSQVLHSQLRNQKSLEILFRGTFDLQQFFQSVKPDLGDQIVAHLVGMISVIV